MKQKILFLDLDGTLLNDRKEITAGNRRAIREALDRGHRIVITSGRPLKSSLAQARQSLYMEILHRTTSIPWSASFRRVPLTTARNSPFRLASAFLAITEKYGWRMPLS